MEGDSIEMSAELIETPQVLFQFKDKDKDKDKVVRYHNFSSKGNLLSCGLQAGANISLLSLSV